MKIFIFSLSTIRGVYHFYTRCLETSEKNKLATISLWFLAILLVFSIGSNFFVNAKDANNFNGDEVKTYRNLPPKLSDSLPFWNGSIVFSGNKEPNDVYSDQSVPKDDKFILGTDNLGRNLAKRVIVGIRISLLIAIVATLIDLIIGVTYGLVSGFLGGKIDLFMQHVIEVISSIPNLVIVTMLGLLLGSGVFVNHYLNCHCRMDVYGASSP